ncbi:MAG: ATP-binding protein [Polyangiaceae bacterium]
MVARGAEQEVVPPRADCLVESLRAFSYELPTAIADLVDNSVSAGARRVWVDFYWDGAESCIAVTDDGRGMTEAQLVDAMRLGSTSPLAPRKPRDLGRFGLGLKTASFSQCRRLTVRSKQRSGKPATWRWDLDQIVRTNEWVLLRDGDDAARHFQRLEELGSGTAIVWQNLDRLVGGDRTGDDRAQARFLTRADRVREHLAMIFHDLMRGRESVRLFINDSLITPWDPYLQDEPATQVLPITRLDFRGSLVSVHPFVLPHHSKISAQILNAAAGPHGWNAHQGFFVYREGRLLVPGDWLGLGWAREEHYKLARIRLDIPNTLDLDWAIDVTKSRASPPAALREQLRGIAERTRAAAKRVYTFRGAKLTPAADADRVFLWEPVAKHDKIRYRLNREHPLLKQALSKGRDRASLSALLSLIEETVPVSHITIQSAENPGSMRDPFEGIADSQVREVMSQVFRALVSSGWAEDEARDRIRTLWPFELFPALLETIR